MIITDIPCCGTIFIVIGPTIAVMVLYYFKKKKGEKKK